MNVASPFPMFASAWRHRTLIARLGIREVQSRYRGTVLGLAWALGVPLATLAVYLFVFGNVFSAKWDGGSGSKAEYALILFTGLIAFNLIAECANRAPGLMLENAGYIKRVVFPLEVLPWVCLGAALFHAALSGVVLLGCYYAFLGSPPLSALFLPLAILPLVFWSLGLLWFFSSLGVYLRDLRPLVHVATTLLLFLCPVLYPVSAVKGGARILLWLNPLTYVLEDLRQILFLGKAPPWPSSLASLSLSLVAAWLGYCWFMKTKTGFADVV